MMETPEEATGMICIRCGQLNDERASRCSKCRAPLDDFSSGAPWEMGKVKGFAYSPPTSPRTKPIIFWGVWLYFGPSMIAALWMIAELLGGYASGDSELDFLGTGIVVLLIAVIYGALSGWALWAVTKGYFGKKPRESEDSGSADEAPPNTSDKD